MTTLVFDDSERKGTVELREAPYGAELWVDGTYLLMIDLFHRAPSGQVGDSPYKDSLHVQFDDALDYPLLHVYVWPDKLVYCEDDQPGEVLLSRMEH